MKFQLVVELDNDAFQNPNDVTVTDCTELRAIIDRLMERQINGDNILVGEKRNVLDTNGNTVGYWKVTE